MANSLITISLLANCALAHALDRKWPFNAVEAWYDYGSDLIRIRWFDYAKPRKYSQAGEWACAYDAEAWSDGSDQEIQLEPTIREFALNGVRGLFDKCITDPWQIHQPYGGRLALVRE